MADKTPIVFAGGDISVRESLEWLLGCERRQPETFEFAQEFLDHPRVLIPHRLVLRVLNGLNL